MEHRGLMCGMGTKEILRREGYYPIVNGYKTPFLDLERTRAAHEDRYVPGMTFMQLYSLFIFDRKLRAALFPYFNKAESTLKTICAYRFGESHPDDSEAYLKAASYRAEDSYSGSVDRLIKDCMKILNKPPYKRKGFKREYIEHYVKRHDATPIWVIMNYLTFGQAYRFYELQPEATRNAIARDFYELYAHSHGTARKISHRDLRVTFNQLREFRNICAHDERFYCAKVTKAKDVGFAQMLRRLDMVITAKDFVSLQKRIFDLVADLRAKMGKEIAERVLEAMELPQDFALFPMWETA